MEQTGLRLMKDLEQAELLVALGVLGEDLFAGFYSGGVRRRPISQMITATRTIIKIFRSNLISHKIIPNPFNPYYQPSSTQSQVSPSSGVEKVWVTKSV